MAHRSVRSALSGRGFLLFPAAAFAVHQLRYRLGYGSQAADALTTQGHGYVNSLAPWAVLLLALALGVFLARLARTAAGHGEAGSRRSFAGLWLLASISLVAIYATQESLEGLFTAGHPSGLAGIVGHGGWWGFVLAAGAGFIVAVLLRIASAVAEVAARLSATAPTVSFAPSGGRPITVLLGRPAPLAGAHAGRAPPLARCAAVV